MTSSARSKGCLLLLLCLVLSVIPIQVFGQSASDVCAVSTSLDDNMACASYMACIMQSTEATCEVEALQTLLSTCGQTPVNNCEELALLHVAAYGIASLFEIEIYEPEVNIIPLLGDALVAADSGNYARALELYSTISDTYEHRMIPYSNGVIYVLDGNAKAALVQFERAIQIQFPTPLAFYSRGRLLEQMANTDAERDLYAFFKLLPADSSLPQLLGVNTSDQSFDTTDTFLLYPTLSISFGPGGTYVTDLSSVLPRPIEYVRLDEGETLAVKDLSQFSDAFRMYFPEWVFVKQSSPNAYVINLSLQRSMLGLSSGGSTLQIEFKSGYADYQERFIFSESGRTEVGVLLSTDQPDPRLGIFPCPDVATASYLQPGDRAETLGFMSIPLYAEPSMTANQSSQIRGTVEVLDGPVCGDAHIWWLVSQGGASGWTTENLEDREYNIFNVNFQSDLIPSGELLGLN